MTYRLAAVVVLCLSGLVLAQGSSGLEPVDQAVGDLDALSTSLRQRQAGLRSHGEQSSLFTVPRTLENLNGQVHSITPRASQMPAYYRVGQGYTAEMDRPSYVVKRGKKEHAKNIQPQRDGEYAELIPANTVFVLDASVQQAIHQSGSAPAPVEPVRFDNRIHVEPINRMVDGRSRGPIDARLNNKISNDPNYRVPRQGVPQSMLSNSLTGGAGFSGAASGGAGRPAIRATTPPVSAGSTTSIFANDNG